MHSTKVLIYRTRCLHDGAHSIDNVGIAACAEHGINFRQLLDNFLRIALHQTSGQRLRAFERTGLLELCRLQNRIDGLLLGGLDKAAGVDNGDIRLRHIIHDGHTGIRQLCQRVLAVHEIFRAAQRDAYPI